jgi:hypothetical protein
MEDQPTVLWSLERDGRTVSCRAKLAPYGIEIDLTSNGESVVTRVFETGEEAMAWAEKKRGDREAAGWRAVSSDG